MFELYQLTPWYLSENQEISLFYIQKPAIFEYKKAISYFSDRVFTLTNSA
jgi:hypothetical protein